MIEFRRFGAVCLVPRFAIPCGNAWIGIITAITVETVLITPPLGMAPFLIKMTLERDDITLGDIYAGSLPFVFAAMVVVGLIVAFPWIASGIPR